MSAKRRQGERRRVGWAQGLISVGQLLAAAHLAAQSDPVRPIVLDARIRGEVVDTIAAQFRRLYLDADTGRLIADHIETRAKAGEYGRITDPYRFAEMLTTDLGAVNGDKHLFVRYGSEYPALHAGAEGLPLIGPDEPDPPEMLEQERRSHYGVARLEILPGNVGYMDLQEFSGVHPAHEAIVGALQFLATADAVIIDLRGNRGGSGEMSNFIISHFVGADSTLSIRVLNRSAHEQIDRWTLATVPGPRRPDVPLYLLTSRATASAAEDFAFVLKNLGRVTIVGDRTRGAGHNNAFIDCGYGFVVSISFTRVMDPKTGAEWEGVGVQPTVAVDPDKALLEAHARAIDQLAKTATGADRDRLELNREALAAELHPHQVPLAVLRRYGGTWDGGHFLTVVGSQLVYQDFAGARPRPLIALSDSTFAQEEVRIAFGHDATGSPVMRVTAPRKGSLSYGRSTNAGTQTGASKRPTAGTRP